MKQHKKSSIWTWLGNLIFGAEPKKDLVVHNPKHSDPFEGQIGEYVRNDVLATEEMVKVLDKPTEEMSELDYWKEKFAIDLEKQEQRKKRALMREQRWLDWRQRQAARDELRFRRSVLRDAQKELRETLRDERDIQRQTDQILQWLSVHSKASILAGGAVKMAGGVVTALRIKPEVIAYIQEHKNLDIAEFYFGIIDDLVDVSNRLEQAEEDIIEAFDYIEKEKEVPLDSVIHKGLEI
jgi:hypothetical protein